MFSGGPYNDNASPSAAVASKPNTNTMTSNPPSTPSPSAAVVSVPASVVHHPTSNVGTVVQAQKKSKTIPNYIPLGVFSSRKRKGGGQEGAFPTSTPATTTVSPPNHQHQINDYQQQIDFYQQQNAELKQELAHEKEGMEYTAKNLKTILKLYYAKRREYDALLEKYRHIKNQSNDQNKQLDQLSHDLSEMKITLSDVNKDRNMERELSNEVETALHRVILLFDKDVEYYKGELSESEKMLMEACEEIEELKAKIAEHTKVEGELKELKAKIDYEAVCFIAKIDNVSCLCVFLLFHLIITILIIFAIA